MRVDTNAVGRDVGRIVQAVSLMLVVSIVVAAVNREFYAIPAFVVSAAIMAGFGTGLVRLCQGAAPPKKREAMVTAATAWALIGVLGGLPFFCGRFRSIHFPFGRTPRRWIQRLQRGRTLAGCCYSK
jgi:trk system potassium uptake protein TrkH